MSAERTIFGLVPETIPRATAIDAGGTAPEAARAIVQPLETVSLSDLLVADLGVLRWRVDGLLPAVACGFIASAPKAFKSWLALDLAIAVLSGQPFLNRATLPGVCSVLYVAGEGGRIAVRNRLGWLCRGRGVRPEEIGDRLHLSFSPSIDLRADPAEMAIRARIAEMRVAPALIVFDPLTRLHSGKEDSRDDLEPVLTGLRRLSEDFQTCVLVIHHSPKNIDHPLRGTSSFSGWFDYLVWPKRKKATSEAVIEVMLRDGEPVDGLAIRLEITGADDDTRTARILVDTAARRETAGERHARELVQLLAASSSPVSNADLRKALGTMSGAAYKAALALAAARGEIRNSGTSRKPAWILNSRGEGDLFDGD